MLFCALSAAGIACAQEITISGKVSDASGKPVAGAFVTLMNARLADTTGPDGTFDFTGKSNTIRFRGRDGNAIGWDGSGFTFAAPEPGALDARLYDARGGEIALLYRGRAAGPVQVPWNGPYAPGLLLRVLREGASPASLRLGAASPAPSPAPAASRKAAAAGEWLQAWKPGYAPAAKALDSYAGVHDLSLSAAAGPDFGPNVILFDPAQPMAAMQARIDAIHAKQAHAQFGIDRHCFLFKPGAYALNVDVGYYTQALGLGASPDETAIAGPVRSIATTANNNVTLMFWRGAENLSATPSGTGPNVWAVSQGVAMRRMHIKGNLALSLGGWASGGFLADSKVDKDVGSGSQQQWYTRNSELGTWSGGVWNMSFTGVANAPAGTWPTRPYTVLPSAPVLREKPFLTLGKDGAYGVFVPALRRNAIGTTWGAGPAAGETLPISMFHIARPDADGAESMNAALAGGKHLILTPGIYMLERPLAITRPGTVVLGLGMANLVAANGNAALEIADVPGVKVAGVLVDAGPVESQVLVRIGPPGSAADHSADPSSFHDLHIRVGGPRPGSVKTAVAIHSNDVIVDHAWIWRADHGAGAGWANNRSATGLVVEGDRVTAYGLFVEHFQEYQTIWNGEGGRTHFYQCELPYDPPTQEEWQHDGVRGWAGYKVGAAVKDHEAWGLGIYSNFRAGPIQCDNGIEAPTAAGVKIRHAVAIWLNGVEGSGIGSVLNGTGGAVTKGKTKATID